MISFLLILNLVVPSDAANSLTGRQVIERSIRHHDPQGLWPGWQAEIRLASERPDGSTSSYRVQIDNRRGEYSWHREVGGRDIVSVVSGDDCQSRTAAGDDLEESFLTEHKLDCANIKRMRNYHVYLYGLPMKLLDVGTVVEDQVDRRAVNGVSYYVVRVPYEEDTWYFYIHPETFALQRYSFYFDESKQLGELISLEDTETVEGIRIPKRRSWRNTHDDEYLGTDTVVSGSALPEHY